MKLGPFEPHALWYYSTDGGEYYRGGFTTKEEAEEEAAGDDPDQVYTIAYCHTHVLKLSDFFDVDEWLEQLADGKTDDYTGEDGDPIFDLSKRDERELQQLIRATIDSFQVQRGLRFKSYWFHKCTQEYEFDPRPKCTVCGESKSYIYTVEPVEDPWQCDNCLMLADAFDRHG